MFKYCPDSGWVQSFLDEVVLKGLGGKQIIYQYFHLAQLTH